ncbi:MAG: DHA2 family efflux MFS transporter permease subunit [Gallionella sp.]
MSASATTSGTPSGATPFAALPVLHGPALLMLTIAAALSTFMEILDITIANVSVPTIAGALGVSSSQGTWIISAYSVAAAIAVPLTGWMSKRVGEARLFVYSVLAFTFMSTLAAFSQNLTMLVIFRLLQGFVSGPMVPLSQTLLVRSFPPEKRGAAMGIWAMTVILAPICGPLLGGYISDNYHWSWIFLINIPIGLFGGITIWVLMRHRDSAIVRIPLDKIGLALMVLGIGCLQLMLEIGHDHDWFSSPYITALGLVALVSLTFFIAWGIMTEHPIVDVHLMRDVNFRYGVILWSVGFMTYFGTVVVFPLWLQLVMGYSAAQAGMATAPIGVFTLILAPIIGRNIGRINLRMVATFAFAVMGAVSVWNSFMTLDVTFWDVVSPRLVQGIGMACFFLPVQALMLSNITPDNMAAASGLSNFLRTLGAAIGTAISVTAWEHLASLSRAQMIENINVYNPASTLYLEKLQSTGLSREQAYASLDHTVFSQSYMIATNQFFLYSAALFFLLTAVVWLTRPGKAGGGAMGH